MGVGVLRLLRSQGVKNVQLKWPNDILIGAAKLGGILIEGRVESGAPRYLVIGIGLSAALGDELRREISALGMDAADLASATGRPVLRNALAAGLIKQCIQCVLEFERGGLASFINDWSEADALRGCEVSAQWRGRVVQGLASGIDEWGRLIVETGEGRVEVSAGDVHARAVRS